MSRPGTKPVTGSHRTGSASSTPTPSTSSGGPSRDISDAAKTSTKPTWPSPAWSPTAPPSGNHTPASTPGQHARTLIAHQVVTRLLGDPRGGWLGGDAEHVDPAGGVLYDREGGKPC